MSYPPQSRYNQPDYPDEGYLGRGHPGQGFPDQGFPDQGHPDREYRDARTAPRRYPDQGPDAFEPPWRGYADRPDGRSGSHPQVRYSAPPSPARPAAQGGQQQSGHQQSGQQQSRYQQSRQLSQHQPARHDQSRYDPGRYDAGRYDDDLDDEPVKRRTGLKVVLIVFGTLLLLCAGGLFAGAWTIHDSYPAHVSLAEQLAGLAKLDNPDLQSGADDIVSALKTGRGVSEAVAGIYAQPDDATHPVMILAAAGLFPRPEQELLSGMTEFNTDGFSFDQPVDVPAGPQGGAAKCSAGAVKVDDNSSLDFILCGWADYGSVGMVGFFNSKDAGAAAGHLLAIRDAVETH